jgi:ribonuclease-3
MLDTDVVVKACAFELFSEHVFHDRQLLFDAVVSKGYPNEHQDFRPVHRQALLANMGDAIIDVLTTEHLIRDHRMLDAGDITKAKGRMVKRRNLNLLGKSIIPFVAMTSGEENELYHSSTPGESLEAMVGALYLDGGLPAARRLLVKLGFFEK